jgi:hypothetical protein
MSRIFHETKGKRKQKQIRIMFPSDLEVYYVYESVTHEEIKRRYELIAKKNIIKQEGSNKITNKGKLSEIRPTPKTKSKSF